MFRPRVGIDSGQCGTGTGIRRDAARSRAAALPVNSAPGRVRSHCATSRFARRIRAAGTVGTTDRPPRRRLRHRDGHPRRRGPGHRASRRPEGLPASGSWTGIVSILIQRRDSRSTPSFWKPPQQGAATLPVAGHGDYTLRGAVFSKKRRARSLQKPFGRRS